MTKAAWQRIILGILIVLSIWTYAHVQGGYLAWHLFGFTLAILAIVALGLLSPLNRVQATRILDPGPFRSGDTVTVRIRLEYPRWWPWNWITVEDILPSELAAHASTTFTVSPWLHARLTLEYKIQAAPRGIYHLSIVTIRTGDIFGFITHERQIEIPATITVWPQSIKLHTLGLNHYNWQGEAERHRGTTEESSNLRGIRDYAPGDRLSQIHWRTSARTGAFKVKQFEPFTQPQLHVNLDYAQIFDPAHWELAVSSATSLVEFAHFRGQAIGLMVLDSPDDHITPGLGHDHLVKVLDYLAALPKPEGVTTRIPPVVRELPALWITSRNPEQLRGIFAIGVITIGARDTGNQINALSELPDYLSRQTV
ncbi:MAG: DUF58 domain-containing protein [Sulfobacillus sp.]